MRPERCLGCTLVLLVVLASAGGGWAAEAAPAAPAPTAPKMTDAEHHARGEVLYDGQWVPLRKVFVEYRELRAQVTSAERRTDSAKDRLAEVQREMAQIRGEVQAAERPIRAELGKARGLLRQYNTAMNAKPPDKPQLRDLPPRPDRPSTFRGTSSSSSNYSYNSRYDDELRDWQRRCDAIKQENDAKIKKYQAEAQIYQKAREEAQREIPKVQATIVECEKKLKDLGVELEEKQAPTRNRSDTITEEVQTYDRRLSAVETRLKTLVDAMRTMPEDDRLRYSVVEFEDAFYSLSEVTARYTETQAEIDRVREQLKADAEKMGLPFPDDWRHPEQPRMDAMKALIDKATALQRAKPPVYREG